MAGVAGRRREGFAARRERLADVADPEIVLAAGLRFLEARSRSIAEVRRRLSQAGYRPELIEGAITRLVDLGMLDDTAFATAWIESRDRANPRGEHALRRELSLKGIERPIVDSLLATRAAARDPGASSPDEQGARTLLERQSRALSRVADPRARRQRAYALLARHGFDPETCSSAVRTFFATEGDAE